MRLTILDLRLPAGTWPGDVSNRHRKALLLVESYLPQGPDKGTLVVRVRCPDPARVLADIEAHASVQGLEVIEPTTDGESLIKIVTGEPRLLDVAVRFGVVPDLPLVIQDGQITWRIRGQQQGIQSFREALQAAGVTSEVRFVGEFRPEGELTPRQRDALTLAVQAGFYDYPRRTTLTRLAKELGVAPSTLSETLMVVEKKVVHRFMKDTRHDTAPE